MLKKSQSPNSDLFKDPPEGFQQSVWESKSRVFNAQQQQFRVSSSNTQEQSEWESKYPVSSSNTQQQQLRVSSSNAQERSVWEPTQSVPTQRMTIRAIATTEDGGLVAFATTSPSRDQRNKK